ncbi:MAG: MarR family transcriptional regulator [Burkholderiaceae bacterium]
MKKSTLKSVRLLDDDQIGVEARVGDADHQALKVWLRLLACSTQIETEIRRRLRAQFGMTLARFDYLAQLHRHPEGLRMSALSRYLMVTGGNVTALTDDLEAEGLVVRETDADDRRSFKVALTAAGRKAFEKVAQVHEGWVVELLSGLGAEQKHELHELLGRLRVHLSQAPQENQA